MEEHFILRVPSFVAERLHRVLNEDPASPLDNIIDLQVVSFLEDGRTGNFVAGKDQYPAALLDLPCVMESFKTYDDNVLIKTADVGQNLQLLLLKEETRLQREQEKRRRGWGASQYTACWKKFCLTAFPGELTARIESVLNVLNEIPGILEETRQANNELVDASSALPYGLPFGPAKRSVPLEHAEAGIRNALESRQRQVAATTPFGPLVVVLHGGPGSFKNLTKDLFP